MRLVKDWNPCDLVNENGEISFAMKINGTEQKLSSLVLANFYFEYALYCIMRKDSDLYAQRLEIPKRQSIEGGVWVASVFPRSFSNSQGSGHLRSKRDRKAADADFLEQLQAVFLSQVLPCDRFGERIL